MKKQIQRLENIVNYPGDHYIEVNHEKKYRNYYYGDVVYDKYNKNKRSYVVNPGMIVTNERSKHEAYFTLKSDDNKKKEILYVNARKLYPEYKRFTKKRVEEFENDMKLLEKYKPEIDIIKHGFHYEPDYTQLTELINKYKTNIMKEEKK